jgi:hypothetical protein
MAQVLRVTLSRERVPLSYRRAPGYSITTSVMAN